LILLKYLKNTGKTTRNCWILSGVCWRGEKMKLDLTKEYKTYYTAKTTPEIVEIEEGNS